MKLPSLKKLWAEEPEIVGTTLPILVNLGVFTADQAHAISNAVAGTASVVSILVGAFVVRQKKKGQS